MNNKENEEKQKGLKVKYRGVKIDGMGKKSTIWWCHELEAELKSFVRDNMDITVLKNKLDLYRRSFYNESDKENGRIYLVMIHQLYFELLEYMLLLLKATTFNINSLPMIVSLTSTQDIRKFSEELDKNNEIEENGGNITLKGRVIELVIPIVNSMDIRDDAKEICALSFHNLISRACGDFNDRFHRNVYNSIKHGNRGKPSDGKVSLLNDAKESYDVFDTDYSYIHTMADNVGENKDDLIIKKIYTFISSEQVIKRCDIVLGFINFIHYILKKHLGIYSESDTVQLYDFHAVEDAWTGLKNNGHMFEFNVDDFVVHDRENMLADGYINISMDIKMSIPRKYSHPLYNEMRSSQAEK